MNPNPTPSSHPATGFGPAFTQGRAGGRLYPTDAGLRFDSPFGQVELPWGGLIVRPGGHDGRQLFFEHPQHPEISITVSAAPILGDPRIAGRTELRAQLAAARRVGQTWSKGWIVIGVALLALGAALIWFVSQKDRWVRMIADRVPVSFEVEIGKRLMDQIRAEGRLTTNAALEVQVQTVTHKLLPALAATGYEFEFSILQDTNLNAFALPGGPIVIHTGLLDAVSRPEELAGVLAHELAHITQRHGLRRIIEQAGLMLLVQTVFGDTSGLEALLIEGSRALLQQKYSRDFEREADARGWDYLVEANIDPRGMIDFFKTMKRHEEKLGASPGMLSFLSTHPATDERMADLEQRWERTSRKTGFTPL